MLRFFSGVPRAQQSFALQELADSWSSHDVFVVELPVATGKSKIAEAVVRWAAASPKNGGAGTEAAIVVPTNLLLDQYLATPGLPGFRTLHAKAAYRCHSGGSCEHRAKRVGGHCRSESGSRYAKDGCPYLQDLGGSRGSPKLVCNQHVYMANKLQRPVAVFDEAHSLLHFMQDFAAKRFWRSTYKWPRSFACLDDVREFVTSEKCIPDPSIDLLKGVLDGSVRGYSVFIGEEELRGVEQELVKLIAIDVRDQPPWLWPAGRTEKIVLLSATINRLDVEALGLAGRRVKYISTDSPIPAAQRPLIHHPVADLSWRGRQSEGVDKLASFLEYELLPAHAGERGLVHAPYALARELRELMAGHPRLVYHDVANKRQVVSEWLAGAGRDDRVLVASGMHEGLDLAGDRARFQVLTAPPRGSIADPGLLWLAEEHPEQYEWLTIREIAQAYGRICRNETDYGVTVCVDSSISRELSSPQLPKWLAEARVR